MKLRISNLLEVDDEIYVKYNEDKTLQWLKCKVEAVVGALKKNRISASLSGSRMTGFTTGRENEDFNKGKLPMLMSFKCPISRRPQHLAL